MKKGKWPKRTTWKCQRNADTQEIGWNLQRGTCIDLAQWRANLEALANRPDWELPQEAKAEGVYQTWQHARIKDILRAMPKPKPDPLPEPERKWKPSPHVTELARLKYTKRTAQIVNALRLQCVMREGDSVRILKDTDGTFWRSVGNVISRGGVSFYYSEISERQARLMVEAFQSAKPKRTRKPKFRTLRPNVRKFRYSRAAACVVELTA